MAAQIDNSKVWIGGVPVDRLTSGQWCKLMISDWQKKKREGLAPPKVVTTVNGQVVSLFTENPDYRQAVLSTDHVAADGMSVVFASRMVTESPLPERVATTDWFHAAAKAASRHGIRFYVLGATRQMNELAVKRIRVLYPYLQLAGARDGYFDRNRMEEVAEEIGATRPDVLWIGVGNPDQLLLAHQFKQLIPSLTWIRTCGGLFDFLSGLRSRAPQAMQAAGLEWAYRMALEPRRLGWRYATTNVTAAMAMARDSHGMH
jgi:N-acetylglucosaminyldiphosphoundecaprenol N-acetyl-beta-D-mannosaminyltransferase